MKQYHRGDEGYTDVIIGRVSKDSPVIELIGQIDELIAVIGIARSLLSQHEKLRDLDSELKKHQLHLFRIASYLARGGRGIAECPISSEVLKDVESRIKELSSALPKLNQLIIPSGPLQITIINFARTVCRRVERYASRLLRSGYIEKAVYVYLNRLSDLLYLYMRYAMHLLGVVEEYV
ncbi:MAG TPA: cob(I)yrinic acid a,c-diamide adenosyltransferase [Ignisphaera sp.]|uniref:Cob(I)yrinic acid a,c-diamide adenosyltransferase n=1 Tax=Ignisphaera aggregans TaxID=334771 RepID=A0A832YZH2_9CREN|nr:cob(I)yrinic acid a,c-diamide adenosyltransferase [Ignisphaera sp.]HIP56626.1 cob(I)yrinic acid a,c-diamide adenosyltransferase [Ignisphaera aggregans]